MSDSRQPSISAYVRVQAPSRALDRLCEDVLSVEDLHPGFQPYWYHTVKSAFIAGYVKGELCECYRGWFFRLGDAVNLVENLLGLAQRRLQEVERLRAQLPFSEGDRRSALRGNYQFCRLQEKVEGLSESARRERAFAELLASHLGEAVFNHGYTRLTLRRHGYLIEVDRANPEFVRFFRLQSCD